MLTRRGISMECKQCYVDFFLYRNKIKKWVNFAEIEEKLRNDKRIRQIIGQLQDWPGYELKTHKDIGHPLHQLSFLAELGFNRDDPGMAEIINKIFVHQSEEGPFNILVNIPKPFGGSGQAQLAWMLCDATVVIYSLLKLNQGQYNRELAKAVGFIAESVSENGWHCMASRELGSFHGPGRSGDPCPYATMFALRLLGLTGKNVFQQEKEIGIRTLLHLWKNRDNMKPYLFGMGTDFKKLKLPFVWYDILNVVDTLSVYPQIYQNPFFREMLNIIKGKKTEVGYIPESVYRKAKEWDFGQKKEISPYMNAIIDRIVKRVNQKK